MKLEQKVFKDDNWQDISSSGISEKANLVFAFGSNTLLKDTNRISELKNFYPSADIIYCSTAGEIVDSNVYDETIVATAINFEKSNVKAYVQEIKEGQNISDLGVSLGKIIDANGLKHLFVLSDGTHVNGSELINGLISSLPKSVAVTGGLAGDGERFQETLVGLNEAPSTKKIVALGFYGDSLQIGCSYFGGWVPFGAQRRVTKAEGNTLYELDGQNALDLYKQYLGPHAKKLPASGLLFPLFIKDEVSGRDIIRTLIAINDDGGMVFAGNIPVDALASFTKAAIPDIVNAAGVAAEQSASENSGNVSLALLVSCVCRKMVLKHNIADEVKAVKDKLGGATLAGYYSYGEICPYSKQDVAALHNQTMTVTTFSE